MDFDEIQSFRKHFCLAIFDAQPAGAGDLVSQVAVLLSQGLAKDVERLPAPDLRLPAPEVRLRPRPKFANALREPAKPRRRSRRAEIEKRG